MISQLWLISFYKTYQMCYSLSCSTSPFTSLADMQRQYQCTESNSASFDVFCETCRKGKMIFSSCNRDGYIAKRSFCTLQKGLHLALQALHTHHWAGCLWTCRAMFTHQEIMSSLPPVSLVPAAGDKWTMNQSSHREVTALFCDRSKGFVLFSNWEAKWARWIINSW